MRQTKQIFYKFETLGDLKNGKVNGQITTLNLGHWKCKVKLDLKIQKMDCFSSLLRIMFSIITQHLFASLQNELMLPHERL